MRIIDVQGLGWDAAIDIEGETILLLEADLDIDDRIGVMTEAMGRA